MPTHILWFEGISSYEILCQGSKGSPRGEVRLYMTCNVEKVIVLNLWVSIMNWLIYTHDLAKVTVQQPSNVPLFAVSAFLANILMYKYISNCRAVPCLFIFFYTPAGKYSFMYMHATLFSSNVYKLLLESDLRACDYCTRKKKEYLRVESINSKIFTPLATNPHTQFYLEGHVTSSLCAL
jgi:hypothetical protein